MSLFHITSNRNAESILREGFCDGTGHYLTDQEHKGVWVSSEPFDGMYLSSDNTLFAIEVPEDVIIEFEWAEEGKTIREFLVPGSLLNSYGPPVVANTRSSCWPSGHAL